MSWLKKLFGGKKEEAEHEAVPEAPAAPSSEMPAAPAAPEAPAAPPAEGGDMPSEDGEEKQM